MDFSDLMNIAATKQQVTEKKGKSKKSKGNESQVSSEAVKAFLARLNAQKARQKEQEESAKRARIEARLRREQADKSKNKKKDDTPTAENDVGNTAAKDAGNKKRNLSRENDHRHSTTGSSVPPPKNKTKVGVKRSSKETKETKHVESKGRECRNNQSSDKRFDEKEKRKVPPKATKPAAATLSFQELMNVAKKQVNNPDAMRKLTGNPRVKQEETKSEKVESKTTTDGGKDAWIKSQIAVVVHTSPKSSKKAPAKQNTANVRKKKEAIQEDVCKRKAPSVVKEQTVRGANPQKMTIERATVSEKGNHYPAALASDHRKRQHDDYDDDDDDDYEEEMDEFIDDSETAPDISSCIKEIFGYDRHKFRGKDDDVENMESSFADIQREEAKSTRIAKLEDEIERLKETYELGRSETKKTKK